MTALQLQQNLLAQGCSPGTLDGDLGPKTYTALLNYLAKRDLGQRAVELGRGIAASFPTYRIDSPLRNAHALGQAAEETGGFKWLHELGDAAYFEKYDGRKTLGNVYDGDGARFKGRGIIQITGRNNYKVCGDRLGVDLIAHPEKAEEPGLAVKIFCLYWSDHHLNDLADKDDVTTITKRINGGKLGLEERKAYVEKVKAIWPS